MQIVSGAVGMGAPGCGELEEIGLVSTSECCEACHSAERFHSALGPCRTTLPDGREAFVCCAAKKQLLGGGA